MRQSHQRLHRDLPQTTVWGYDGQYPGPTFDIRRGQPIAVRWLNDLPNAHLLPVAPTIHGAESPTPEVRTVVHVHGLKVLPDSDGHPEAWFTNGFAQTGGRLWKTAEIDHRVPLFCVWRERRDTPWPELLSYWGLPNLQVINRDVHAAKCADEAKARSRSRKAATMEGVLAPDPYAATSMPSALR
jgi:spore coat protein A